MDKYDPNKNVALLLDEWGTWWDEEPGTVSGHLYQQNTLRDAFVASLSLDIFHKYTERLKMANIAQIVNVLQSMILTDKERMVLTPTYYVFKMYNVHQDATYLPVELSCDTIDVRGDRKLPLVSATASKDKDGKVHISLSNIDLKNYQEVTINLQGVQAKKAVGEILTSAKLTDCNTFDNPDVVKTETFKDAKISKGVLKVKLPAKSIVTLELQ
jgi:alpha-N-arabinofuranosidase